MHRISCELQAGQSFNFLPFQRLHTFVGTQCRICQKSKHGCSTLSKRSVQHGHVTDKTLTTAWFGNKANRALTNSFQEPNCAPRFCTFDWLCGDASNAATKSGSKILIERVCLAANKSKTAGGLTHLCSNNATAFPVHDCSAFFNGFAIEPRGVLKAFR